MPAPIFALNSIILEVTAIVSLIGLKLLFSSVKMQYEINEYKTNSMV
jgi:hypothetical protein